MTHNSARTVVTVEVVDGAVLVEGEPVECQYFAGCHNAATCTVPNPIVGDVPSCDSCAEWCQRQA